MRRPSGACTIAHMPSVDASASICAKGSSNSANDRGRVIKCRDTSGSA
jgi:hypothetical protein